MNTKLLKNNDKDISAAAEIIKNGGLVAAPTETVYGLCANAFDGKAVSKIFKAKGRAPDNPLIVHISDFSELSPIVKEIPKKAEILAKKFWGGPLTMIFKSSGIIPKEVTCGLETVAVRIPSHPVILRLIRQSGCPIAAPSANISGGVSPVTAQHCAEDLSGKIDAIIDGGKCSVGIESTVLLMCEDTPKLLRPGFVTVEQIEAEIGEIAIDKSILNPVVEGVAPKSPGMKYKHYSPLAKVMAIIGDDEKYYDYVNNFNGADVYALCFEEDIKNINKKALSYGAKNDAFSGEVTLFEHLRKFDEIGAKVILARMPNPDGVGLAVTNRLLRASAFEVVKL